jgi:hypothetical protein
MQQNRRIVIFSSENILGDLKKLIIVALAQPMGKPRLRAPLATPQAKHVAFEYLLGDNIKRAFKLA